ncbi:CsbD family protein [Streptococcus uberis]|uniref:CsbD family protein n=1 Tax=Streptococcus uberis TaxID=1349 RepID=UPI003D77F1DD
MSEEKFDAKLDQVKGSIKEGAGKLTGDKELEAEGTADKVIGKGKELVDDAKEAVKGIFDSLKK